MTSGPLKIFSDSCSLVLWCKMHRTSFVPSCDHQMHCCFFQVWNLETISSPCFSAYKVISSRSKKLCNPMFDTCSCSFLNFLFPVSFFLNSQCWCQNHVQHLPLYFSLLKKNPSAWDALLLTSQSPISHFLCICTLFFLHLCPLLLRSIRCHQTPSFLCFCPFILFP